MYERLKPFGHVWRKSLRFKPLFASTDSNARKFISRENKTILMWNAVLRTDRRNQVKHGKPEFSVHKDSFFFNFCKNELEYRLGVQEYAQSPIQNCI
ncbi:MAG: hypothetical protein ACPG07_06785, partial [Henriciella sp.]